MRTLQHHSIQDHDKCQRAVKKVINQLDSGENKSADRDQKAASLWTVKLNRKKRLFFAEIDGNRYLLLIDEEHNYNKSLPIALKRLQEIIKVKPEERERHLEQELKANGEPLYSNYTINPDDIINDLKVQPEAPEEIKIKILRKQVFQLSREQEDLVYCTGSFIAYGVPGSGKTSSALYLIEQLVERAEADSKPIVFLAQSTELVKRMQKDWESLPARKKANCPTVIFQTVEEFTKQQLGLDKDKDDNTTEFVGFGFFEKFFEQNKNCIFPKKKMLLSSLTISQACKIPQGLEDKNIEKFICQALYQEFCLLAAKNKANLNNTNNSIDYINHNNSYFNIENNSELQQKIIELLNTYRDYLTQQEPKKHIDPAISVLPSSNQDNKPNATIVLDEGQNIPLNTLEMIAKSADEICVFMDDDQNTQAAKSSILLKQKMLKEIMQKEIPAHPLRQSFRCSQAVNKCARTPLIMRDRLAGISTQVAVQQSDLMTEGSAKLYTTAPQQAEPIEEIITKLSLYKPTERLVIIQHQKSATNQAWEQNRLEKSKAQELFPDAIICFPEEVPGLEFDCVVLYQPLGANSNYYNHDQFHGANKALKTYQQQQHGKTPKSSSVAQNIKHAAIVEDYRFSKPFQELYMLITRARDSVIIIQKKLANINEAILDHWSPAFEKENQNNAVLSSSSENPRENTVENIKGSLANTHITNNTTPKIQSSEEDWHERISLMSVVKGADKEQIRALVEKHLYQNIDKNKRYDKFMETQKGFTDNSQLSSSSSTEASSKQAENHTDNLSKIINKLVEDKNFKNCRENWSKCLTKKEKEFLLDPDTIYILAAKACSNNQSAEIISRIFIFNEDLIEPSIKKIKSIAIITGMLSSLLRVAKGKNNESNFYKISSGTNLKFLTCLASAYVVFKSDKNLTSTAKQNIQDIPKLIYQGLTENPNTNNSLPLLTQLHRIHHHPIFIQLIEDGLFDFSNNLTLMQYLKLWKADSLTKKNSYLEQLLESEKGISILEKVIAFNTKLAGRIFFDNTIDYFITQTTNNPFYVNKFLEGNLGEDNIVLTIIDELSFTKYGHAAFCQNIIYLISFRMANAEKANRQENTQDFFIKLVTILNKKLSKKNASLPVKSDECFAFSKMILENAVLCPQSFIEPLFNFIAKMIQQIGPNKISEISLFLSQLFIDYLEKYLNQSNSLIEDRELFDEAIVKLFVFITDYFNNNRWDHDVFTYSWDKLITLVSRASLNLSKMSFHCYLYNKMARAIALLTRTLIQKSVEKNEVVFVDACNIIKNLANLRAQLVMPSKPNDENLFEVLSQIANNKNYQTGTILENIKEQQIALANMASDNDIQPYRNLLSENFSALTKTEGKYLIKDNSYPGNSVYVVINFDAFNEDPKDSHCSVILYESNKSSRLFLASVITPEVCEKLVAIIQEKSAREVALYVAKLGGQFIQMAETLQLYFPAPPNILEQQMALTAAQKQSVNGHMLELIKTAINSNQDGALFKTYKKYNFKNKYQDFLIALAEAIIFYQSTLKNVTKQLETMLDFISPIFEFFTIYKPPAEPQNSYKSLFEYVCIKTEFNFLNIFSEFIHANREKIYNADVVSTIIYENLAQPSLNGLPLFYPLHKPEYHAIFLKLLKLNLMPELDKNYFDNWKSSDKNGEPSNYSLLESTSTGKKVIEHIQATYPNHASATLNQSSLNLVGNTNSFAHSSSSRAPSSKDSSNSSKVNLS